jgi:[protein-PII] uridylyltransferase
MTRPPVERTSAASLCADHRAQVVSRRRAATRLVGATGLAAARVATAPPGYLLAHDSSDVARHCALLSPLPAPDEARAVVTPGRARGTWNLEVASRDQPGLLAAFTGVLAGSGIEVMQAVLATWDDGGALEAFIVRSPVLPDSHALEEAFEASLERPLSSPGIIDAHVVFDDRASPLYTGCDVRAADRPGLLHAIAVAFATAGADVHAARVITVDGLAHDRFDLSDRTGRKLDASLQEAIRTGIICGPNDVRFLPKTGRRARKWNYRQVKVQSAGR